MSISVFFPAYNDGGTIPSMVILADQTCQRLTDDYEIIVVNDGSTDSTGEVLAELQRLYPRLRVIEHGCNRGYGHALRSGFEAATGEWVFYTDGDAQYDPRELVFLTNVLNPSIDVVNGYKRSRCDPLHRKMLGRMYHHIAQFMFGFRLRDVDCDFRLIRKSALDAIELRSDSGTICLELVKKLQDAGFGFAEVPVHHYARAYGRSQFFNFPRLWRTAVQFAGLWFELRLGLDKRALRGSARLASRTLAADSCAIHHPHGEVESQSSPADQAADLRRMVREGVRGIPTTEADPAKRVA